MQDKDKILNFIKTNKAITLIDEVIAEFPELSLQELNQDEIKQALKNNAIKMQSALKIKLFKSNTTQSLLELNHILQNENNSERINNFIDEITREWKSDEY